MLFTNDKAHGGAFGDEISNSLIGARNVKIATGYIGAPLIDSLNAELVRIAGIGVCKIVIGMVFHSGLREKQLKAITELDDNLRKVNPKSGVFITVHEYHGKVYFIDNRLFMGSSNFSDQGFFKRRECTIEVNDPSLKTDVSAYVDKLFSSSLAKPLSQVDLTPGTSKKGRELKGDLSHYAVSKIPFTTIVSTSDIELRVDDQPASSLNLCFDKGRKNSHGKYAPRPWYEIEITTSSIDRRNPNYPKTFSLGTGSKSRTGSFNAFIEFEDSVYKIKMSVGSDSGKAIASHDDCGGRETLGMILKGKLEKSGSLKYMERITSETLDLYGSDKITLNKFDDNNYELVF